MKGLLYLVVLKEVASLSDIYSLEAVAMNTMEDPKFERFLKHSLLLVYAKTVVELLPVVVMDNCYGCEVDHPSQAQHTCLMGTISEHLHTYFEETFNHIKYELMVFRFWEQIVLMDIFTEFKQFEMEQVRYWWNIHMPTSESVRSKAEQLLSV